ncbi:MAG: HMA2 domain-containing protein [Gammaproteobacteria bacterium]
MIPSAHIAHMLPDRVRIRIPEKRHDAGYFASLASAFGVLPGIEGVEVNASTASLLLHQRAVSAERIGEFAEQRALFRMIAPRDEVIPLSARLADGLQVLDARIRAYSEGRLDFWGAVFLLTVGISITQFAKGNISAPASTLLWYALGTFAVPPQWRASPS